MAMSPVKRHVQRTLAAQAAAKSVHGEMIEGVGIVEQLMMQLASDRARLQQIQSAEGKAQLKLSMIEAYEPYIAGVLESGVGAEDPIVGEMLVWYVDIGRFDRVLEIGGYVLKHGMKLPDRFARTTGCFIAEEIAEAALTAQRLGTPFDLRLLTEASAITDDQDMPDDVRAKLHLAAGRALLTGIHDAEPAPTELDEAVFHLKRALALNSGCGGKKDLERAERLLKKHAANNGG